MHNEATSYKSTHRKRVVINNWTILPFPAEVISTVYQLAVECKKFKGITFKDEDGYIIKDKNDPE